MFSSLIKAISPSLSKSLLKQQRFYTSKKVVAALRNRKPKSDRADTVSLNSNSNLNLTFHGMRQMSICWKTSIFHVLPGVLTWLLITFFSLGLYYQVYNSSPIERDFSKNFASIPWEICQQRFTNLKARFEECWYILKLSFLGNDFP